MPQIKRDEVAQLALCSKLFRRKKMKYKVRINQEKLEELKKQLKPGHSWWALVGIIVFLIPEVVAYIWGDDIIKYCLPREQNAQNYLIKLYYKFLKSFGKNSILNLTFGLASLIWFFKERRAFNYRKNIKYPDVKL